MTILTYLEGLKTAGATDLVLRRFSPLDYAVELTGPVNCPFAGCVFSTERGVEMSHHQETSAHPGWHRLGGRAGERSWLCSFQGCGSSFFKWNNLYNRTPSLFLARSAHFERHVEQDCDNTSKKTIQDVNQRHVAISRNNWAASS